MSMLALNSETLLVWWSSWYSDPLDLDWL